MLKLPLPLLEHFLTKCITDIFLHPVITKFQVLLSDVHRACYSIYSNCHMTSQNIMDWFLTQAMATARYVMDFQIVCVVTPKRTQVYKAQAHTKYTRQND